MSSNEKNDKKTEIAMSKKTFRKKSKNGFWLRPKFPTNMTE
jgi:hypothetical protein